LSAEATTNLRSSLSPNSASFWDQCSSRHARNTWSSLGVQASGIAGLACAGAEPGSGVQANLVRIEDHVDCHREVQVTRLCRVWMDQSRTAVVMQHFVGCPDHRSYGHPGIGLKKVPPAPGSPCLSPISKSHLQSLSNGYRILGCSPGQEAQLDKELDSQGPDLDRIDSSFPLPTTLSQAAHSETGALLEFFLLRGSAFSMHGRIIPQPGISSRRRRGVLATPAWGERKSAKVAALSHRHSARSARQLLVSPVVE
jgi:hypothetical protein